jgi:hypothetical protein
MLAERVTPADPDERRRARREEARRRVRRRRAVAIVVLLALIAAVGVGTWLVTRGAASTPSRASGRSAGPDARTAAAAPTFRPFPTEMRGVHVTMELASIRGKLRQYMSYSRYGLNTIEIDVKDENGEVAFRSRQAPLATRVGAAHDYYDPTRVARTVHRRGFYLVGRVVTFEDPVLSVNAPRLAIQNRNGGIWRSSGGLGWTNPYNKRVWDYNVSIAVAAAKAGFDEIMFDYVRFPSDGDVAAALYRPRLREPRAIVISRFLAYARRRLHPLGVRVGAAVFGLAATRELGIGQQPRRLAQDVDVIHPMVYPSHYGSGEYSLPSPEADPADTVWFSLRDFHQALAGEKTRVIPWLQDFSLRRTYELADVKAQIKAARSWQTDGFMLWNPEGVYTQQALAGK